MWVVQGLHNTWFGLFEFSYCIALSVQLIATVVGRKIGLVRVEHRQGTLNWFPLHVGVVVVLVLVSVL